MHYYKLLYIGAKVTWKYNYNEFIVKKKREDWIINGNL